MQLRHGCTARRAISTESNLSRVLQAAAAYAGASGWGLNVLKQHTHFGMLALLCSVRV